MSGSRASQTPRRDLQSADFQSRSSEAGSARWQTLEETIRYCQTKPWLQKYPDVAKRMFLNGETPEQMAFAEKIQVQNEDHSVDAPWEIDTKLLLNDRYVLITTFLMLTPKVLLLTAPCFMFTIPIVFAANHYYRTLPVPTDRPIPPKSGPISPVCILATPLMAFIVSIAILRRASATSPHAHPAAFCTPLPCSPRSS